MEVFREPSEIFAPKSTSLKPEFSTRPCPCCGARHRISSYKISAQTPAESRTFDEIKRSWAGFFKLSTYFTYRRCASCGQLYCPVFFDLQQLIQLYSRMSDNTATLPVGIVRKTQTRYFDILQKFGATTGTYMELGPDIGLLTEVCLRKGNFRQVILIEPNLEVHKILKQKIRAVSNEVHADLEAYKRIQDGSLDTIVMIHVLDHILDPADFLANLRKKLKPGGKLFLVTHDESSLLARVLGARWPAYCLQHPHLYNPRSIRNTLERQGFKVMGVRKTYNYFPVMYLLKHLFWTLRLKISFPNWYWLTVPIKLGNIATIATTQDAPL